MEGDEPTDEQQLAHNEEALEHIAAQLAANVEQQKAVLTAFLDRLDAPEFDAGAFWGSGLAAPWVPEESQAAAYVPELLQEVLEDLRVVPWASGPQAGLERLAVRLRIAADLLEIDATRHAIQEAAIRRGFIT
jgi:hypothetical protein